MPRPSPGEIGWRSKVSLPETKEKLVGVLVSPRGRISCLWNTTMSLTLAAKKKKKKKKKKNYLQKNLVSALRLKICFYGSGVTTESLTDIYYILSPFSFVSKTQHFACKIDKKYND